MVMRQVPLFKPIMILYKLNLYKKKFKRIRTMMIMNSLSRCKRLSNNKRKKLRSFYSKNNNNRIRKIEVPKVHILR